ncbi:hypothetical protein C8R46DRAFT_1155155 [Mycena filopes]|nr:hypothetical protein C8R46DRAFT_1155155 [Mycena filopes]
MEGLSTSTPNDLRNRNAPRVADGVARLNSDSPPILVERQAKSAGQAAYDEFEGLFQVPRETISGSREARPSLADLYLVYRSFENLHLAYKQLFTSLSAAMRAAAYLVGCSRGQLPDHEPEAAREAFYTNDEKACDSLVSAAACWDDLGLRLPKDIERQLRGNSESAWSWLDSLVSPWLLTAARAESQALHSLQTDLHRFVRAALDHIAALTESYTSAVAMAERDVRSLNHEGEFEPTRLLLSLHVVFYGQGSDLELFAESY